MGFPYTEIRKVATNQRNVDMIRYFSIGLWQMIPGGCGFLRGWLDHYVLTPANSCTPGRVESMAGAHESAPLPDAD